jgi:integrase
MRIISSYWSLFSAGSTSAEASAGRPELHTPVMGDDDRRRRHLDVLELSETLIARGEISPKSVRNCIGIVSSIFRLAVLEGAVEVNPVSQTPRDGLPSMGSSGGPTYSRDEALALLMDPRIGWDRRVVYALQFFTGMRIGEVCGRRWHDWKPDAKPLGSLRVHSQYDDQPLKTAKSGDSKERMVPVHPELEKVLWCWQGEGFEAVYGRPPGPDDFIVPDPRNMAARTQSQATKAHKRDAELIGVRNKGSHALRRFMISAARSSGACRDVLEQITHNARGAIIDIYTSWEWPALCEAVSCLKVDPDRLPARIYDISYDISVFENANCPQSLRLISGGGGNRPYCQRYAKPARTLGFPAYRYRKPATRPLTPVSRSTLESSRLPCALVIIWSFRVFGLGEREGGDALRPGSHFRGLVGLDPRRTGISVVHELAAFACEVRENGCCRRNRGNFRVSRRLPVKSSMTRRSSAAAIPSGRRSRELTYRGRLAL